MIYADVCTGIAAASVAWHPLGWRAAWHSEIEPFPCAVLKHHYPDVPNLGDMTKFKEWPDAAIDLLVGGTPCQSYSVAGLRKGLADPRGNLMLTYLAIAKRYRPRWVVWENVPGVLSSNKGRDFGTFLGALAELGYGFAYRVLDAQYVRVESHARAVPQRRRRVFVVGYLGDWRPPAAVLFERESLLGHPPPRREPGQGIAATLTRGADSGGRGGYAGRRQEDDENIVVAPTLSARTRGGGGLGTDFECGGGLIPDAARALTTSNQRCDAETETLLVAHALCGEGFDASEDGTGRGTPVIPVHPYTLAVRGRGEGRDLEYRCDGAANTIVTPCGGRDGMNVGAVVYAIQGAASRENVATGPDGIGVQSGIAYTLEARAEVQSVAFSAQMSVPHADVNLCSTLQAKNPMAVAFAQNQRDEVRVMRVAGALASEAGAKQQTYALTGTAVRRLTPRECERLQGFADFYTAIPFRNKDAADGPRYKAIGNSMAIPPMRWIGNRIKAVDALLPCGQYDSLADATPATACASAYGLCE